MKIDAETLKKQVILHLPYILFLLVFAKLGEAVRLAPGADASQKLLGLSEGFALAFQSMCTGSRRIRFGKNALFHQAQSDANAQFLRRHRSERYSPCGMRKDVAARHTKAGQGRKAYA